MLLTNREQQDLIDYIKNDINSKKEKISQNLIQNQQAFENWFSNKKEAAQYIVKNLNNGLVAYYPFDEFIPKANSKLLFKI